MGSFETARRTQKGRRVRRYSAIRAAMRTRGRLDDRRIRNLDIHRQAIL
jgi:hypothetical protein